MCFLSHQDKGYSAAEFALLVVFAAFVAFASLASAAAAAAAAAANIQVASHNFESSAD